jgi:hypothetical protein
MMNNTVTIRRSRKGAALLMSVVVMVIFTIVGEALLLLSLQSRVQAERVKREAWAQTAADAGAEETLVAMRQVLEDGNNGFWGEVQLWKPNRPLSTVDAAYSVHLESWSEEEGGFEIRSSGLSGNMERDVYVTYRLKGLFESAVLARNNIDLKAATLVDSVNTEVSLDPNYSTGRAQIGTCSIADGSVSLGMMAYVDGPIFVGPDGDIETVIDDHGALTGPHYVMAQQPVFPTITAPEGLIYYGTDISVTQGTIVFGPSDSGCYSTIDVVQGNLEIEGGDVVLHVTGDISLGMGTEIIIRPDSSLELYFEGDFIAGNSNGINCDGQSPRDLMMYAIGLPGQQVILKAKGDFFGAVYAPDANVVIHNGGDVYGSIVCDTFEMKNNAAFYYDEALRDAEADDQGVRLIISAWREE